MDSYDRDTGEPPRRRFSLSGALFAMIFGFMRLMIFTAVLMALAGLFSFHAVRAYVRGSEVKVPALLDETCAEALLLLDEKGLIIELEEQVYNSEQSSGVILSQSPEPGAVVKVGSPVRVVLSIGAMMITVPDLRGIDYKQAEIQLDNAGLKPGRQSNLSSRTIEKDEVITTDPPPLSKVKRNSRVNLLVSNGLPRYEISMPRLVGKSQSDAEEILGRLGLEIAMVREIESLNLPSGQVVEQTPSPGNLVETLNSITVTVARGRFGG